VIQDQFSDTFPSGDPSVDQGDTLSDGVTVTGNVLAVTNLAPTGEPEDDGSVAGVTIARGPVTKSLYAINGGSPVPARVAPGDTVTYRITYRMPASDVEDLYFIDYFPLPVFDVMDPNAEAPGVPTWTYNAAAAPGTIPAPGEVTRGPTPDTFTGPTGISGITPTLTPTAASNSLLINYGWFDDPLNRASVVDLLFTLTVTADPFADGLFLTNQVRQHEGSTNSGADDTDVIIQIQVQEPVLFLTKGIGATSSPTGAFTPPQVTPPGVTFNPPGSNPSWSGLVNSSGLASQPIDSDLAGVDAGDLATFALVIENRGSSPHGAFDIRLRDLLAPGYVIPGAGAGLNLQIRRGNGTLIGYQALDASGSAVGAPNTNPEYLFYDAGLNRGGLELLDPSDDEGVCQGHDLGNGANIVILTYDLQLAPGVEPGDVITNTASVTRYASRNGGPNFLDPSGPLTDRASVTVRTATSSKIFMLTSEAHTSDAAVPPRVAIGEIVRYRLVTRLPEGTATNFQMQDLLPAGMGFLDDGTARVAFVTNGPGMTSAGYDAIPAIAGACTVPGNAANGTTPAAPLPCALPDANIGSDNSTAADPDAYGDGIDPFFKLGTLTNADSDADDEFVVVEFNALVRNVASNGTGTVLSNGLRTTIDGAASGPDATPVNVRTAQPSIPVGASTKTVAPTTGDAGDVVTYTVTFTAANGADNADAFEVRLVDNLTALPLVNVTFGAPSFNAACQSPSVTNNSTPGLLDLTIDRVRRACAVTLTYTAELAPGVFPGQLITNTFVLTYTSLPGTNGTPGNPTGSTTPGAPGAADGERTGSGVSPNTYRGSDTATVTVLSTPVKSIVSTSEAHTGFAAGFERLAIGEIVRYRLQFPLPEGVATNLQFRDLLPAGMQFLDDNTAMVVFVSNGAGITSSTLAGPGLNVAGNEATIAGIHPTFVLPDLAVSNSATVENDTYGDGTDPFFKFGNITNNDRDADTEFVVVEFNAILRNVAGNQGYNNATGAAVTTTRADSFQVTVAGVVVATSASVSVRVSEPLITNLAKVVTTAPGDAGDTVVYTLTYGNNGVAPNGVAAFEIRLTDTLNANLALQSVVVVAPGSVVTDNSNIPANLVDISLDRLNPGALATLTITARVVNTVQAGLRIPNSATVTYTSLPGTNGTPGNPTGSVTPGLPGTATGERTGSGGVNDYTRTVTTNLTLTTPSVVKQAPVPPQQTIGGEADYDLLVSLPEGAVTNLRVRDALPAGLAYLSHSVITTAAGSGGLLANDYNGTLTTTPACPACVVGASGITLEFQFGNAQTNGSGPANGTSANQFLVRVRGRVLNVAGNQNGTLLTNTASLAYINPQTGDTTVAGGSRSLTVTEPELSVGKVADDATPGFGQVITFRITVSHLPSSTAPAYELSWADVIPAGLTYVPGSLANESGVAAALNDGAAPTLSATWPALPLGQNSVVRYQATVGSPPAVSVGDVLTNAVALTWTSLSGPSGEERTGAGGLNDYRAATTAPVTVTGPDVRVAKTDGETNVAPGDTLTYTITITNDGNSTAPNVLLTDTLPANTTFQSASGGGVFAAGVVTWPTFDLAALASTTRTVTVRVDDPVPSGVDSLTNTAEARDDGTAGPDPTPGNNTATDVDTLDAGPDLVITKDDGVDIVTPGTLLIYAIRYDNVGDQDATGVEITETVPSETTFVAASSSPGWSCPDGSAGGTTCTQTLGNLAAGAGGNLTFAVRILDPVAPGTMQIVDTVSIRDDGANGVDPTPGNNSDTDTDNLLTQTGGNFTKSLVDTNQAHTVTPAAAIGEILTYELVLNVPQGTMTSVVLTDILDLGLAFETCQDPVATGGLATSLPGGFTDVCNLPANPAVAAEPPGGVADQGRRITFDLGALSNPGPASATLTLRYTAVVLDNPENVRGLSLNNRVTWNWVGGQLIASAADVVLVEPTLTLAKDAVPRTVPPGGVVTFTLTIANVAPPSDSPAFDLVLTDTVPVGMTYVPGSLTASGGGTVDASAAPALTVTWPALGLGDTVTASFQATMGALPAGTRIRNDGFLAWSTLPGDVSAPQSPFNVLSTERIYDPPINANVVVAIPSLPATGFAPDRVSSLPAAPAEAPYANLGAMLLEIPALKVSLPIVGVPAGKAGWDLTWLWDQAGYLEGTAYPTHRGNSALTAHVVLSDGTPGPFARLQDLRWGDRVLVRAYGQVYTYEVRTVARVNAGDLRPLSHKDQPWLTLITCHTYDEAGGRYLHRIVVQAVLMDVTDE
jgi:LPXTG-site transpeptidase (sortase) family protein